MTSPRPTPTSDEVLAVMECFRYGDVEEGDFEDIKRFYDLYGSEALAQLKDERGNTALHMAGGNGHTEIVEWLVPKLPIESLSIQNESLSTPLHWIAINYHLSILHVVCPLLPIEAFSIRNKHDKTAVEEAEEACESLVVPEGQEDSPLGLERVKREKCVGYLLGCMGLGVKKPTGGDETKAEETEVAGVRVEDEDKMRELERQAERIKLEQESKR
ncbi:ankyrin repeat domain-containing protein [Sporobolomyces koalae]|uniref:ankyrin repeat domain-containing protein n=1 Tax=Sporobolomyces koalae TaxID=500713 RepID=UPI00317986D0